MIKNSCRGFTPILGQLFLWTHLDDDAKNSLCRILYISPRDCWGSRVYRHDKRSSTLYDTGFPLKNGIWAKGKTTTLPTDYKLGAHPQELFSKRKSWRSQSKHSQIWDGYSNPLIVHKLFMKQIVNLLQEACFHCFLSVKQTTNM